MARQRSPARDEAKKLYLDSKGKMKLVDIAASLNIKDSQVRKWKSQDEWERELKGALPKTNSNVTNQKVTKKNSNKEPIADEVKEVLENTELTDKQRLFCLYFIKNHNQTLSAIKAGYVPERAHITGSELVRNSKVAAELRRLKGKITEELYLDAMDVLNMYIKIAFVDPTEYLAFGQKEVPVMTMYGPLVDKETKETVMKTVNYVDFKESSMIDGTVISEVKQGKDGVSIKFEDRMKALDKLSEYFDLFPDKFKRQIEEEKVKMAKEKIDFEKNKTLKNDEPIQIVIRRKERED
ncbi:PBSX phage terminase small subunit [Clostridium gelidum]|uniref:PBSX phage terminase small subunit n=1 Tax=Clostridium gelidum TaxID=704125 RepID=A0ABM7T5L8_9CLOT|nr:terminase small subunit [Clostridium gelidum]BCZ46951.1 PBSX phage terminase small subunit [Clostridium gelidum]